MCKANGPGVFAMKVDIDVWWMDENNDQPLYDPGRGVISVFLKGELTDVCEDGSGGVGVIQTCGDTIPPLLVDATCKAIQIVFPDEMWEKPGMPKITTTGSTTGFNPDDVLTFAKAAGVYGIELKDPTVKWPTFMETANFACASGTGAKCVPDSDGDGKPGITVTLKQDGSPGPGPYTCPLGARTYIPAPIDTLQAALDPEAGAVETYIGLRSSLAGGGKIGADCKSGTGPAQAEAFESRLIDCKLKSGMACTPANANFVDQNLPNFHVLNVGDMPPATWKHPRSDADTMLDRTPSKGPRGSLVRLADPGAAVTCEQVRKATFPPLN
jgi:hypothetical protein